jgi:very-short-patch-repair endonuclease
MLPYNPNLKHLARQLRFSMTDAENRLWQAIRKRQLNGFQFYRQKNSGEYIVDFFCPAANLVIELDGGQHYSDEGRVKDEKRDAYLKGLGLRVLRFSDREVFKELEGVLERVMGCLEGLPRQERKVRRKNPPQPPFRKGGKEGGKGD